MGDAQSEEIRAARPVRRDLHAGPCRGRETRSRAVSARARAARRDGRETIAFEDSPNGILAAKRAGIYCVAVPNELTKDLALSLADHRLRSLEEFNLDDV
jgi:phosphoglycolate phosphatase-like HAD superfamily hydrolase